jgi:hypothetical protein
VPCTKAAVESVDPFVLGDALERHGACVWMLFGFVGVADHPAGRSATERRRRSSPAEAPV